MPSPIPNAFEGSPRLSSPKPRWIPSATWGLEILPRLGRGERITGAPIPDRVASMAFTKDPRVDAYIDSLPDWQQAICRKVRALVHAADPDVVETIKRTNRPYFVLDGNICALLAAKDHVNVFVYDPIAPDPEGIITSGHENETARTVAIRRGERFNERALRELFRAIIA